MIAAFLPSGCFLAPPGLPEPVEGHRREVSSEGMERCWMRKCTTTIKSSAGKLTMITEAKTISPREAMDLPRESLARRILTGATEGIARSAGGSSTEHVVGIGTRTVTSTDSSFVLSCSVAWMDRITRTKKEDETETARLAEGLDCRAFARSDSERTLWTFRRGIDTKGRGMGVAVDTLLEAAHDPDQLLPMSLTSHGGVEHRYAIVAELNEGSSWLGHSRDRWIVRRGDGRIVGVITRGFRLDVGLDVASDASTSEISIMRLLAALALHPLRSQE